MENLYYRPVPWILWFPNQLLLHSFFSTKSTAKSWNPNSDGREGWMEHEGLSKVLNHNRERSEATPFKFRSAHLSKGRPFLSYKRYQNRIRKKLVCDSLFPQQTDLTRDIGFVLQLLWWTPSKRSLEMSLPPDELTLGATTWRAGGGYFFHGLEKTHEKKFLPQRA